MPDNGLTGLTSHWVNAPRVSTRPSTPVRPVSGRKLTGSDGSDVLIGTLRAQAERKAADSSDPSGSNPASQELVLLCGACREPVAAYDGYLYVSLSAVGAYERAEEAWDRQHPEGAAIDLHEMLGMPDPVQWRVTHNRCDERPHFEDCYHISPERITTWSALTRWSAHLMCKNWLAVTDWDELLREAAGDVPATRIRAAGSVAA